jgi:hypothetical protein
MGHARPHPTQRPSSRALGRSARPTLKIVSFELSLALRLWLKVYSPYWAYSPQAQRADPAELAARWGRFFSALMDAAARPCGWSLLFLTGLDAAST